MNQQKLSRSLLIFTLMIVALWPLFGQAQAQTHEPYVPSGILVSELAAQVPPGRLNVRFPLRDPDEVGEEIRRLLQETDATLETPVLTQIVPLITAEIEALSTGLEDDPLAIYDYVHNHVDYIPSWGLLKNPRETLLAGAGNAFDQAALLAALLNAAGFETRYVWGNIRVSKAAAMNWMGATDPDVVGYVFADGGIPTTDEGTTLRLTHIWLRVRDGGTWHDLDPSFKTYDEQVGQNLRSLMGYDQPTFIGHAEDDATITADYVQYLNQANIRDDLGSYALNLVNYLRSGDTFIYLKDLIGGRQIVPIESADYPPSLPYQVVSTSGQATNIPDSFAYTLTIRLPGLSYTVNVDDIAGERITIFYECATSADCQRLEQGGGIYDVEPAYRVNMVPRLRVGGEVVATGSAVPLGSWDQRLDITVTTPIDSLSFSSAQYLIAGEWYALPMRLQTVSNRALARHVDLLDEAMSQGLDPDDEQVLGQILYLLGLSYFNEADLGDRIDGRLAEVVHVPHFSVMIASRDLIIWIDSQWRPVALDPASHTVDVRLSLDSVISAQNPANANRERAWFFMAGMRGSAVEHAIIEQLRPVRAISTVQALKIACGEGQRIYYITPSNWNTVYRDLGHPEYILNWIVDALNSGLHVIISQDPVTYGEWQGSGWIELDPESGSAGYLISGYLGSTSAPASLVASGGGGVDLETYLGTRDERDKSNNRFAHLVRTIWQRMRPEWVFNWLINTPDPTDTATGTFLYHHRDLAPLGGLGIPLGFERFYASSQHSLTSNLGYGWSHTYNTHFYISTDWVRGFGGRMALEAAPALATTQVVLDLFDVTNIPHEHFAVGVTAAQWLMTQITGNVATLIEPDGTVAAHVRLSDGAYQPPAGGDNLDKVTIAGDGSAILDWEDGTRTHFNADGRPVALDDANGNRTTLSYDGQGRLSQVRDAVGRSLTFTYDLQGHLSQISDPPDRTFRYGYDGQGNLQTYTDPRGGVITYAYDAGHRLTRITDPSNITYVTNQYDALGRVTEQVDGRSGHTSLLYGGDHTIVTAPMGYRTTYFYDERTRLLGIEDALGIRTSVAYDAADHEVSRTNGLGQTTSFVYDTWGHLTTTTDPLGYTTTWAYDTAGDPVSFTDERGKTWHFAYDERHNLSTVTDPSSGTTYYTYNGQGQLTQAQDPAGVSVTYAYDGYGNLTCLTNALGEASCWSYDIVGRPISFTDGTAHTTQFSYDAADNLIQVTGPLGHPTSYTYDANGNLIRVTDAKGHIATYGYDAQFNLTSVTDAIGGITTYDYDANDGLVRITDANGHQTTYQRDPVGRVMAITDPLTRTVSFTYDAADRLTAFGRADGSTVGYQRDALGRLTGIDYPTGPDIAYNYDAAGNLISAVYGGDWSAHYVYDDVGRLSRIEEANRNLTLGYDYDPAGRRTGLWVSRDTTLLYDLRYSYDGAARLSMLTDRTSNPAGTIGFSYDAAGRMIRITDSGGACAEYTYAMGRLVGVRHQDNEGGNVATYEYTYDAVGNIAAANETTPVGTFLTTYTYDAIDRLIQEIYPRYTIEYAYDAVGNLIQCSDPLGILNYTYDAADQLRSRGSECFSYDQHGNLIAWENVRGTYNYTYDYENLLTNLTLPDDTALAFTYDAFGRRLTAQGPVGTRSFLHDGLDIILEGEGDLSEAVARYLYGDGLLVARHTAQLGFSAYHGDALENVRYLMDSSGRPLDAYRYDAYGHPVQPAGIDFNPFRFVGQRSVYQHDVPGWAVLLMGYRYYDPTGGRFLTRDPLPGDMLRPHSLNDYSYALGNPLRYTDPTGLRPSEAPTRVRTGSTLGIKPLARTFGEVVHAFSFVISHSPVRLAQRLVSPAWDERLGLEVLDLLRGLGRRGVGSASEALGTSSSRWLRIADYGSTYVLTCTADDRLLAGAFGAGLFRSTDAGHTSWHQVYTASLGDVEVVDANTYYAGTWYSGALKSNDGGAFWEPINNGLAANDVYALAADPTMPNRLFAGTEMGLFVSNDGGLNWVRPTGNLPGRVVSDLAFSDGFLLAVTDLGLYRRPDGGDSWQRPSEDLPTARINVLLVGSSASTVYAGTALGAYMSTDSGNSWTRLGTGLEDRDVHALAIDPADASHVVAGTTSGLFISNDSGSTWTANTREGLDGIASQVGALAFCPNGGEDNLYLGTGGGVYALRAPVAPTSVTITGPTTGSILTSHTFTATVSPITTTLPITYTWQATGQPQVTHPGGGLSDTAAFSWGVSSTQVITVTADNGIETPVMDTHTITVTAYMLFLPLILYTQ